MDLTFKVDEKEIFNVRAAAIIKCNNYYLISKREDKDYYSVVGGRIAFNEDSKAAILREIKEELNWDIDSKDAKLVRIIENFFIYSDNVRFHEYLFVYLIDIQTPDWQIEDFINLENPRMHMKSYNKENYLQLNIKPSILKDILTDDSFKHLIIKE